MAAENKKNDAYREMIESENRSVNERLTTLLLSIGKRWR